VKKVALITGITGQDGSYLAEFLLEKGYEVHGIKRRASLFNTARVDHIYQDPHAVNRNFFLHYGDLTDSANLTRIVQQTQPDEIYNLDAMRDWGHAKDYVRMQWLMLQQEIAEDFGIATGQQISVRSFIEKSAAELGIQLKWHGTKGAEYAMVSSVSGEKAPAVKPGDVIVRTDPRYYRPTEVETLLGDATKAKQKLGWVPEITLEQMIEEMIAADLEQAKQVSLLRKHGYQSHLPTEH